MFFEHLLEKLTKYKVFLKWEEARSVTISIMANNTRLSKKRNYEDKRNNNQIQTFQGNHNNNNNNTNHGQPQNGNNLG